MREFLGAQDRYQVIRKLGEGGQGKVYYCFDRYSHDHVAVKLCKGCDANSIDGLQRDVLSLSRLQHDHIVRLIHYEVHNEELLMVLEYAWTDLMVHVTDKGLLEDATAKKYFGQLMSAVDHCHKNKIVHRDLKLANLLLVGDVLKVSDFGLAKILEMNCDPHSLYLQTHVGSHQFAPPEILARYEYEGPKADVWSAGIVLFTMNTGFFPWIRADLNDQVFRVFKENRKRFWDWAQDHRKGSFSAAQRHLPALPTELIELLDGMLNLDPRERWSVSAVLKSPWLAGAAPVLQHTLSAGALLPGRDARAGSVPLYASQAAGVEIVHALGDDDLMMNSGAMYSLDMGHAQQANDALMNSVSTVSTIDPHYRSHVDFGATGLSDVSTVGPSLDDEDWQVVRHDGDDVMHFRSASSRSLPRFEDASTSTLNGEYNGETLNVATHMPVDPVYRSISAEDGNLDHPIELAVRSVSADDMARGADKHDAISSAMADLQLGAVSPTARKPSAGMLSNHTRQDNACMRSFVVSDLRSNLVERVKKQMSTKTDQIVEVPKKHKIKASLPVQMKNPMYADEEAPVTHVKVSIKVVPCTLEVAATKKGRCADACKEAAPSSPATPECHVVVVSRKSGDHFAFQQFCREFQEGLVNED